MTSPSSPLLSSFVPDPTSTTEVRPFGTAPGPSGGPASLFVFQTKPGLRLSVTNYGATVTSLLVPDARGQLADVVAGHDDVSGYVNVRNFFGATVGRVANRIKGASFSLEGKAYAVAPNEGSDQLHGGPDGFDRRLWQATPGRVDGGVALRLTLRSPAGDQGYPGALAVGVTYALLEEGALVIEMEASSDETTLINLAHHGYWNLGGHASGTILNHELELVAECYTPGAPQIPDGRVQPVAGTPFDFRLAKPIGRDLAATSSTLPGYDHNFVVDGEPDVLRRVAGLRDPKSGRVMTLFANQPGVQFYNGIYLDCTGKGGVTYPRFGALCLETQAFPNAINVPDWAPSVVLRAGQRYHHVMKHVFTTT